MEEAIAVLSCPVIHQPTIIQLPLPQSTEPTLAKVTSDCPSLHRWDFPALPDCASELWPGSSWLRWQVWEVTVDCPGLTWLHSDPGLPDSGKRSGRLRWTVPASSDYTLTRVLLTHVTVFSCYNTSSSFPGASEHTDVKHLYPFFSFCKHPP